MRVTSCCRVLALAALLPCALLAASPDSPPATVEDLVREALDRNPDLRAARSEVTALRTRPAQVESQPDPTLALRYQNDGWTPSLGTEPMSMLEVVAAQTITRGGKLELHARRLALDADHAAEQVRRAEISVATAVRRAHIELARARGLRALALEQGATWADVEEAARVRYSSGLGSAADMLRAQIEKTRVEEQLATLAADEEALVLELNRLRDRDAATPIATDDGAKTTAHQDEPEELLIERLAAESPELRAAQHEIERARVGVARARADFVPDLTMLAGFSTRASLGPMWQAGVSLSLPLHRSRLEAAVAEMETREKASEMRREAARQRLAIRTRERLVRVRAAATIERLYREGLVPQTQASADAVLSEYGAGRGTLAAVLQALAAVREARAGHLRAVAASALARVTLEEGSLVSLGMGHEADAP